MEKTYRILDKRIQISLTEDVKTPDVFDLFSCPDGEADLLILSDREVEKQSCYGLGYLSGRGEKIQNVFFSQQDRGQILYSLADDYSYLRLQVDGNCTQDILSELLMAGFYSYISLRQALLLHASAVSYQEKAIIFTAPSGVGKTTQAELWKTHRNATIINGDKVFLTKDADRIIAWGSPWKGSSAYAENMGVEAAAIVVLEQAFRYGGFGETSSTRFLPQLGCPV